MTVVPGAADVFSGRLYSDVAKINTEIVTILPRKKVEDAEALRQLITIRAVDKFLGTVCSAKISQSRTFLPFVIA